MQPRLYLACPTGELLRRDPSVVLEVARLADAAGVTALRLPDHVLMADDSSRYPWGPFPYATDVPWLDPLVTIAAMAPITTRLRFCTSILIAPLRPAPILAKMAATIDVLSRGRLELGVGVGWQQEEFDACGRDFSQRGAALWDTIAACRALWSTGPSTFSSPTVSFAGMWCEPKPVQQPGIPVFFSGRLHARNIERIVALGDGWIPIMDATAEDVIEGARTLTSRWTSAGRDPEQLHIQARLPILAGTDDKPDVRRTILQGGRLVDAGVTDLQVASVPFLGDHRDLRAFFHELGDAWAEFLDGRGHVDQTT